MALQLFHSFAYQIPEILSYKNGQAAAVDETAEVAGLNDLDTQSLVKGKPMPGMCKKKLMRIRKFQKRAMKDHMGTDQQFATKWCPSHPKCVKFVQKNKKHVQACFKAGLITDADLLF